jgi:hypothetical protein
VAENRSMSVGNVISILSLRKIVVVIDLIIASSWRGKWLLAGTFLADTMRARQGVC